MSNPKGQAFMTVTRLPLWICLFFFASIFLTQGFDITSPWFYGIESEKLIGLKELKDVPGSILLLIFIVAYLLFAFGQDAHLTKRQTFAFGIGTLWPLYYTSADLLFNGSNDKAEVTISLASTGIIWHGIIILITLIYFFQRLGKEKGQ